MVKTNPKDIVKRLKQQEAGKEKVHLTLRLTKAVVEDFKRACEKQGVGAGKAIEEFMKDFVEAMRESKK